MRRLAFLAGACVAISACGQGAAAPPVQPIGTASPAASHAPASVPVPIARQTAVESTECACTAPEESSPGAVAAAPTISPAATVVPATKVQLATSPPAKRIGPLIFISQTLNNRGPASIAEVLNYYGVQRTQAQVAAVLRPNLPDYGMSLYGVPFYAESVGMNASGGINGSPALVKAFVANGLPVIIADLVSPIDRTRHFRPIDGYDDAGGYFIGSDPYLGPNHKISYSEFDELWKISTQRWVVIHSPDKRDLVDSILARYWSKDQALQAGFQRAQQRMSQQPNLPWTWLELADLQIEAGDLKDASANIQKGTQLGLPFEAHWLQLKLQRASGQAA
jgi:hypothetical protein